MKYNWIDDFLLSKKGVTKDFQEDWNWIRYKIDNKMFVAICLDSDNNTKYITLKLNPIDGEFFRNSYEDIIPGLYEQNPLEFHKSRRQCPRQYCKRIIG